MAATTIPSPNALPRGVILERWLDWLERLMGECVDEGGALDLDALAAKIALSKQELAASEKLAEALWRAVETNDIAGAEAIIASVDKDHMLAFGECALRVMTTRDAIVVVSDLLVCTRTSHPPC